MTESTGIASTPTRNNRPTPCKMNATRLTKTVITLALLIAGTNSPLAETILLRGATVHTVSGPAISSGDVLVKEDKIVAVGIDLADPDARVIDLKGRHLYPGLILMDSALGLSEIEAVRATQDTTEVGEFKPDVQSWIAVNPDSELIPVARANGITHAEPSPQGGLVAGQSGVIALEGWTVAQMTVKHPAALHVYWPDMSLALDRHRSGRKPPKQTSIEEQSRLRRERLIGLNEFFQEARAYAKGRELELKNNPRATEGLNPPYEAMLDAVRGKIPVMVHADDIRQIKAALQWAQTNQLRMILVGGRDAAMAAGLLAPARVPVVFERVFAMPERGEDSYDINFRAPEALSKAGVTVAFAMGPDSMQVTMARNLPYEAAQAAAFGLPKEEALKAITLVPAQLLGVADRLGSIEPGKEASLFVADGDILDIRSRVNGMWIAGKEVSMETRHTRLHDKYKDRPRP